jgi:hypothetical protein
MEKSEIRKPAVAANLSGHKPKPEESDRKPD